MKDYWDSGFGLVPCTLSHIRKFSLYKTSLNTQQAVCACRMVILLIVGIFFYVLHTLSLLP